MSCTTMMSLSAILVDADIQQRTTINESLVADYSESIADWQSSAPLTVFHADGQHWLGDGFHRHAAAVRAGMESVAVDVRHGGKRDAIAFSLSANATHGQRRTGEDLTRAYQTAVTHGLCDASDAKTVAVLLACSERWARTLTEDARLKMREEQTATIQRQADLGMSQRDIAKAMGISVGTVNSVLAVQKRKPSETEQTPASDQVAMPERMDATGERQGLSAWQLAMLARIDVDSALNGRTAVAAALRIWFEESGREVEVQS